MARGNQMKIRLELNAMVINGELIIDLHYNKEAYKDSTAQWLVNMFINRLEYILNHIEEEKDVHFTSSDFNAVTLDDEELDALFY